MPIFSAEKRKITLKWKEAPTAISYILEVRDLNKNIIIKEETTNTSYQVELEPGSYERRVSIYNKLDEIEVEADWSEFKVVLVKAPELEENSRFQIKKTGEPTKLNLAGRNFSPDMKVKLKSGDKEYPAKEVNVNNSGQAEASFETSEVPEGDYDLVLENGKKSSTYPGVVNNKKDSEPVPEKKTVDTGGMEKWDIVKRSAVVPGWGEYYAGKKLENSRYDFRGKLYFGSFLAATFLYLYFNEFTFPPNKETPTETKLKEDGQRNLGVAFVLPNLSNNSRRIAALYGLNQLQEDQKLVDQQTERTNMMLFLMAGIYITQLVDAYLIERDLGFHPKVIFTVVPEKNQLTNSWEPNYRFGYSISF